MPTPLPCNILLLDDDADLRETLADGLECAGYHVVQAATVGPLFNELQHMNITVAVIDLILAGSNGAALLAYIKQHPRLRHIQVLMISGAAHGRVTARNWGADLFLEKPISIRKLEEAIQSLVTSRAEQPHG